MKIDQMVKREDFFHILKSTVCRYYKDVFGMDIDFSYTPSKGLKKIVINGKFNFISPTPLKSGVLKFLHSEYNIRNSKIKYIVGKLLVYMVYAFPFLGKERNAYISSDALSNGVFIAPQNRSVRFFNYKDMTVDCIIKEGFTDRYFKNQIDFRKNYSYKFMIPMISYGDNWFREPILTGHPLARTTNESDYKKGITDTLSYIRILSDDTLEEIDTTQYVGELNTKISALLTYAKEHKGITNTDEIKNLVSVLSKSAEKLPQIPTCLSHGDLQSGNIWVDENKNTLIYDWETVSRRSTWYDIFVLNYSLRRAEGWKTFLDCNDLSEIAMQYNTSSEIEAVKSIVALEDIIFYLEDMNELPSDWGKDIFNSYIQRILALRS